MNAKTPMALDEVLLHIDNAALLLAEAGYTSTPEGLRAARATIAALQSAHAEEVAGLREELIDQCRLLASGVERELNFQLRAERAEARLAQVEADAARYVWLRDSQNCSLSISHNDHHNMYLSVADTMDDSQGYYDDVPDAERARMIETDTIWTVHVYPNTPVGFNVFHAATLDAAIDAALAAAVAPVGVDHGG